MCILNPCLFLLALYLLIVLFSKICHLPKRIVFTFWHSNFKCKDLSLYWSTLLELWHLLNLSMHTFWYWMFCLLWPACQQMNQLSVVLQLALSPVEEEAFTQFLQNCHSSQADDMHVMYYLERSRWVAVDKIDIEHWMKVCSIVCI